MDNHNNPGSTPTPATTSQISAIIEPPQPWLTSPGTPWQYPAQWPAFPGPGPAFPGPAFPGPGPAYPSPGNPQPLHPAQAPATPGIAVGLPPHPARNPLIEFFNHHSQASIMSHRFPAVIQALLAKPVSYFKESASNTGPSPGQAPLTNVAFVLDCSSSMLDGKAETVEGFNAQVGVIREGAAQAGATTFTEVHFSDEVTLRSVAGSLDALQPLTLQTYRTEGWTALYDALGATIAALLNTKGVDNPTTATLVTLFTDGDENKSRLYDATTLRALVERLEATGRWTFALVGPLQSVTGLAKLLSVSQRNIAGYDVHSVVDKRKAFDKVSAASASYMSLRAMGATQSCALYDDPDLKS